MDPVITEIGFSEDDTFFITVEWTDPNGKKWYSKSIQTGVNNGIGFIALECLLQSSKMVVARKFLEFTETEHKERV